MTQRKVKIFITGHKGMVGNAIYNEFKKDKVYQIITAPRSLDLRKQKNVENFFKKKKAKYCDKCSGCGWWSLC